jgi:ABC-type polysaccharide/polyol phosphate export permease
MSIISGDFIQGIRQWDSWSWLAYRDLVQSYRRTVLGPLWICAQQAIFVIGLSILHGALFHQKTSLIVPQIAAGVITWSLVSSLVSSQASVLVDNSNTIRSAQLPITFFYLKSISYHVINWVHSAVVLILGLVFISPSFRYSGLPIFLVVHIALVANCLLMGLWLAPLCCRFRDVKAAVPLLLQLLMFVSPTFWTLDQIQNPATILSLNPITWFIELSRQSLLQDHSDNQFWLGIGTLTVVNALLGSLVFRLTRSRIAYWI